MSRSRSRHPIVNCGRCGMCRGEKHHKRREKRVRRRNDRIAAKHDEPLVTLRGGNHQRHGPRNIWYAPYDQRIDGTPARAYRK